MLHYPILQRIVFIIGGNKEEKLLVKMKSYLLSFSITSLSVPHCQAFFSFRDGEHFDVSYWGVYWLPLCICDLLTWRDKKSLGYCMHHESRSIFFWNGNLLPPPVLLPFPPFLLLLFNWVWICAISVFIYCILCTSWGNIFVTGWLHYSFELKYPQYHRLLAARHWQDPLPLVTKYVILEIRHPPLFCQQNLSIPDEQCKTAVWMQPNFCRLYLFGFISKGLSCINFFC